MGESPTNTLKKDRKEAGTFHRKKKGENFGETLAIGKEVSYTDLWLLPGRGRLLRAENLLKK